VRHHRSRAWEYRDVTTGSLDLHSGARIDLASIYENLPD
jgi:hypothetical protein